MITLLENVALPSFSGLSFMQTACLKTAFEGSALAPDIWVQTLGGKTTAVISKWGGRLYISAKGADFEELKEFILVLGFGDIFTEKATALSLGLDADEEFSVLSKKCEKRATAIAIPSLLGLYGGLKEGEDGDITLPSFEDFAADVSHRLRHSGGVAILEEYGAALGFCCAFGGIVNGIAVKKEYRGQVFGAKMLNRLCAAIGGEIFVATSSDTAKFYIKNGFEETMSAVIVRG